MRTVLLTPNTDALPNRGSSASEVADQLRTHLRQPQTGNQTDYDATGCEKDGVGHCRLGAVDQPQHRRDAAQQDQEEVEALRLIHAATEISLWGQSD